LLPTGLARAVRRARTELASIRGIVMMSFFDDAMLVGSVTRLLTRQTRMIATQRAMGTDRGSVRRKWVGWSLRHADEILVNSAPVRVAMTQEFGLPAAAIDVIPNLPPALDPVAAVDERVCAIVTELRAQGLLVGVIVANLRPVKGVCDALEALCLEPAKGVPVALAICGDGPSLAELTEFVESRGLASRVRFLGHVDGIASQLSLFDFAVIPSHAEGSANVGFEYAAAGLPFVATAVGGNAALLDESAAGLPVPVRSAPALSAAIARIATDAQLRADLGRAGLRYARTRRSAADVVGEYARLIHTLHGGQ
jgi:glycosyltransferase involved in cell wall biosynthesis